MDGLKNFITRFLFTIFFKMTKSDALTVFLIRVSVK